MAAQFGEYREVWLELLLVVVSYQKDPAAAASVIKQARNRIGDDLELRRLDRIVALWGKEVGK